MSHARELIEHMERVEIKISLKKEVYQSYKASLEAFLPGTTIEVAAIVGLENLINGLPKQKKTTAIQERETR